MTELPVSPQTFLRELFDAAVAAALPQRFISACLPSPPSGRTVVVGAGKASAAMAQALEAAWSGPLEGVVVTRYGHGVACRQIRIVEASHPVPDENGLAATREIIEAVSGLGADDLVIALISGGGSALLTQPANGLTLADKQAVNAALLRSGAPIGEMNCVRRHLSAVKGGRLSAAAAPARVVTIAISDVPGDDPAAIASGPTVPDSTTSRDALDIIEKYALEVPGRVIEWLRDPASETPKPGDPVFAGSEYRMAATPAKSLEAAAQIVREAGLEPIMLGRCHRGRGARCRCGARPPGAADAGGGPQVRAAFGRGDHRHHARQGQGRAQQRIPARARDRACRRARDILHSLRYRRDRRIGGQRRAWCGPETLGDASEAGADPRALLAANDAYSCFEAAGTLVVTGPTLTNVNDFRATLVL